MNDACGSRAETNANGNPSVCRLCREEAALRNSHVLSEFLYQPTYYHYDPQDPGKKKMLNVPSDLKRRLEWPQKGIRERLLCAGCEQRLNRMGERYASGVLKRMDALSIPPGERSATITGVEYAPFKLFTMMQLWHAGVAKYGGHYLYEFTARGHSWLYVASDRFKGFEEPDLILSEEGNLSIYAAPTGDLELRANMLIRQMQEQRRIREGKNA